MNKPELPIMDCFGFSYLALWIVNAMGKHCCGKSDLCHLVVQPFEEFVFGDHDALAELDLGEAGGVDEFVGVCPGDAQELRTWVMLKGNGKLIKRGLLFSVFISVPLVKSIRGRMCFCGKALP